MAFIYDNLTASVIAMTVFLILVSIQAQATRSNTARVSRNVMKTQAQDFITWLEEDLARMGKDIQDATEAYEPPEDSSQWYTTNFDFSYVDASGDTVEIQYDLEQAGTRVVGGEVDTLFQLQRFRNGTGAGSSPSSLGYFELDVVDKDADSTGTPSEVEFVEVQFSVVAPFQNENTLLPRIHRSTVVPFLPARR